MTKTALENKKLTQEKELAEKELQMKDRHHSEDLKERKKQRYFNLLPKPSTNILGALAPKGGMVVTFDHGKPIARHNDPIWYKQYVQDLDKFTNLSTWNRLGTYKLPNTFSVLINSSGVTETRDQDAAGIMVFHWEPSLGGAYDGDITRLPINQILMRTKEQVLKSNSRSNVPYEAADLGLNFIAAGNILLGITEFERAILIAQTYEADNSYYARDYLTALGMDANDFLTNLTDARKYLILLKRRFNSAIVAPKGLAYYAKLMYLGSSWIADSSLSPCAVYAFKCNHYLKLNDDGSGLTNITPARTVQTIYEQLSNMIQVIAENADYISMFADLRSAFADNLLTLDENFDENAKIVVNTSDDAREQVVNIEVVPAYFTDDSYASGLILASLNVKQTDSGFLYQGIDENDIGMKFQIAVEDFPSTPVNCKTWIDYANKREKYINLYSESNGDKILDSTRFKFTTTDAVLDNVSSLVDFKIKTSDIAVVVSYDIYTHKNKIYEASTTYFSTSDGRNMDIISQLSQFDWAPITSFINMCIDII